MNLTIKKIYHKEAERIGVFFPFDFETKEFSQIRIIQQLPGNKDIRTTMTHFAQDAKDIVQSPLDRLMEKKSRDETNMFTEKYIYT